MEIGWSGNNVIGDLLTNEIMLKAKFVRYHFNNELIEDKCFWEVWDGDKKLMTYTVKDIRAGNPICNYDLIATKEFGLAVIARCKKNSAFL